MAMEASVSFKLGVNLGDDMSSNPYNVSPCVICFIGMVLLNNTLMLLLIFRMKLDGIGELWSAGVAVIANGKSVLVIYCEIQIIISFDVTVLFD